MKKLFALLAVVLAVVSCQKDADLEVNVGGEQLVNITVGLPEATRANSGAGFDLATLGTDFELRYILEIYVEGNTEDCIRKEAFTKETSNVVFPVRLVPGRDYRIVAWADIVPTITGERTAEGDYDYYYETSKGLDEVTIVENKIVENKTITWNAMDEYRDAYTAYDVVYGFSANRSLDLVLTRPFAKVRVVSTDIKDIEDLGYELKNGTVEYSVNLNRQFNALNGTADAASAKAHTLFTYPTPYNDDDPNTTDVDESVTRRTLFADYIFVDKTWEQDAIQFTMSVYEDGGLLKTTTFNTDIALHANTLTTIIGEVLTEGGYVKVEVNGNLDELERYTVVSSASHLLKVLNSGEEYILGNNIVVTTADLNEFKPIITRGNNETKTTIINLNGYTVTIQNDGTGEPVVLESGNTLIFAGEGAIQGTGTLVDNSNEDANVVVTGGATVAEGTTTDAVLTGVEALKHVCANGGEFTFAKDLTSSEILTITANNVVINGNGKTLTYTGSGENARAIVCPDTNVTNVTINDLTINCTAGYCQRGINFNNAGTLTLNNVAVSGTNVNYALNFPIGASEATVTINNSNIVGNIALNVWGSNAVFNVNNTILKSYYKSEAETCPAVALNNNGTYTADGTIINIVGGEITAEVVAVENGTSTGVINISENTIVKGKVTSAVAAVHYSNTTDCHTVDSLQEAIDRMADASFPDKIVILRDFVLEESVTIAKNQTIVLDLNGKTITGYDESTGSFGLITNRGNLTVTGNGKITLVAKNNREWNAYSSVISNTVGGKLVVENGTIEHLGGTDMAYGIDNLTNGKGTYAETVINGGNIKSTYRAIRMFLNGIEADNILTVNGGTIEGANKSIWMQDPSANANTGTLVVNEGATLKGDAYLSVTAGSTEWPVEVTIADSALAGESKITSKNVPECYGVVLDENGNWVVESYTKVTDGLFKDDKGAYVVTNAEGLAKLNTMMADKSAGKNVVVNINADIDFTGKTWTPVDSHADSNFTFTELNGNGYTLSNLTINGQAMFTRFAGSGDVIIKDITFDAANVDSNGNINTSILTVQSYQKVTLDNVDVKNSTICGGYKVAPLIATVYNENPSTVTAILKNCDVENTTVKATSYDFCTTGMVAFVYAGNNDAIAFENCTVTNVKLMAPNDSYKAHAAIYTTGSETLYNEVEGVTVTNVTFENI